ncbi:hypothetical protein DL240_03580 [Lujinxingia litoralis]|uniref:Uncharacterized protein n=1 Tax=Lujinxingia litoralis TaxID=2211119 RepID=A0A328CBQ3_9DELT|nr:hypothetical protein [Lujinxingia litoralis]RAL25304.1 hypothetical protein DL240_03580 [Lujinxingia litoralis]
MHRRGSGALVALLALFGTVGCQEVQQSAEPEVEAAQRALVEDGALTDREELAARDGWAAEEGSEVVVETRESPQSYLIDVAWEDVAGYAELDPALVDAGVLKHVSVLELPVLLPAVPEVTEKLQVSTGEQWYTAFADLGDYSVWMTASRVGFERVGPAGELADEKLAESELMVGRASGIAELSFPLANLVYTITVECADPMGDARCAKDDFILKLAESLALAGGVQ